QRAVRPIQVPVAAAEVPALEAGITPPFLRAPHGESLCLEQRALRRPAGRVGGKLGEHLEQRPPRQRGTGNGKREAVHRCGVQIGLERLRFRRRRPVQGGEPAFDLPFPVSRFPFPEISQRSEERRVGKECRSRWTPYQRKKNGPERCRGGRTLTRTPGRPRPRSRARSLRRRPPCASGSRASCTRRWPCPLLAGWLCALPPGR